MNNKFNENTIPKEIYEAFSQSKTEPLLRTNSAFLIYPKILSQNEDEENDELKEMDISKEYKIGNYMVKYTLGQGTFGKVKLGVYLPNDEKVAIKILEKNRIVEKDDEIRVKREFDMLSQFNHPNVILVAEIFESEDSFYSVMEFCEGGELFNYIVKKSRLSEDESAYFFFQLINGLEYIHSLGIVHRDLKPENLLLTSDHILKIIDFGLSNYFKENQETLLSTPCGSPCYASPEMVAGKRYNGFKIDIWSCGIILYAMLCGYLPFEDPDNEVLFKKILECKLEFPDYVKGLSIDLINKILVTDPEKRITIPEIKKHPFFLKGKEIFEEEFSIAHLENTPKREENNNNAILENKKEDKEIEDKENINVLNDNQKNENEKRNRVIEINLDEKENINKTNLKVKEEKIENKDKENKEKEKEKGIKIENIEKIEQKIEKSEEKEKPDKKDGKNEQKDEKINKKDEKNYIKDEIKEEKIVESANKEDVLETINENIDEKKEKNKDEKIFEKVDKKDIFEKIDENKDEKKRRKQK